MWCLIIVNKIADGYIDFSLYIIPIVFAIFNRIYSICCFHDIRSCNITPKSYSVNIVNVNFQLRVYNPFINGVIQHLLCFYNIQRQFVGTKPVTNFR